VGASTCGEIPDLLHRASHPSAARCGISGTLSDSILQDRKTICEILCNGLAREEYRGYDSAGIGIDGDKPGEMFFYKEVGKVAGLRKKVAEATLDTSKTFLNQVSIAHTRWATHGPPSERNCHPMRSDLKADFSVVHNGIITNNNAMRLVLQKRGYVFESETDTECAAVLAKYIWDSQPNKRPSFTELLKSVLNELEGSFAFVFKSSHFPNEIVAARRGSPLLIGVKSDKKLKVDFVDVELAGPEAEAHAMDSRELSLNSSLQLAIDVDVISVPYIACVSARAAVQGPAHPVPCIHVRRWHPSADRVLHCLGCCRHHRAHQARPVPRR
jgi:glutamate synthase domain-containing protein 1